MVLELPTHGFGRRRIVVGERGQRRLQRALARHLDLPADRIVIVDVENPDERPQRQPLQDERPDDDRKRCQDNEVAVRKGSFGTLRKGECRGQRDDAAHAGPRNDQAPAESRGRDRPARMKAESPDLPPGDRVVDHHPGDPHQDHRQEDHGRDGAIAHARAGLETLPNGADLQADEHEGEHVEQEDGGIPDGVGRQPKPRRCALRRPPRDRDRKTHHRENAREAEPVGQDPDAEREDELENDGSGHVLNVLREPQDEPCQHGPRDDAPDDDQEKRGRQSPHRERVHRDGSDRHAVDQQGARVVQKAFAFEDRQDAMGRPELPQDRRCRGRIGG